MRGLLRQNKVNAAIEYINKTRTVHGGLPELPSGLSAEERGKNINGNAASNCCTKMTATGLCFVGVRPTDWKL